MKLRTEVYLENAMDYVQETFENANQWMKENDLFPLLLGANAAETGFCNYRTEQECNFVITAPNRNVR